MSSYRTFAGTPDRWGNLRTRKFHRLLSADPRLRIEVRTPAGRYDFPANLLAGSMRAGNRIIFTISQHVMNVHGRGQINLAGYFSPEPAP